MGKSSFAKSLNTLVFYVSLVTLIYSVFQRNQFPSDLILAPAITEEPQQSKTNVTPISLSHNEINYEIIPQYNYELTGLVVSYEHHSGESNLHKRWKDHINIVDLCVVWKENASELNLNLFEFWNGQFTCNFQSRDMDAWNKFNPDQISNNHILTNDSFLRKLISNVKIGDQIHLRGWLSEYKNDQGFHRGTSITREDEGDGACETIYLDDFEILSSMNSIWRRLLPISLLICIACTIIWVRAVIRGVF